MRLEDITEGKDEGKPGKNFAKITKSAGAKYGSKEAGERVAGAVRNKLAAQGKLEEATSDERFDSMMNRISSNDSPSVDLGGRQTVPDRKIMELTHKIFLRLRDYDDPEVYQKFIEFMIKTINTNVGPLNENFLDRLKAK